MKKFILLLILAITAVSVSGQTAGRITLEECQEMALDNYPSLRQSGILEKAREYSLDKANSMYLPRLTLSGKATYQSDVTSLPISLPGITLSELPKDQYQIVLDLTQQIWDGGRTSSQKELIIASSRADRKILDVELYALKDRVNQIYFGILLLGEQLEQNSLLSSELETNYKKVLSLYNFGVAKSADLDALRVEQLKADQSRTEIQAGIASYRKMLSLMTGLSLDDAVTLEKPELSPDRGDAEGLSRPEIGMYQAQKEVLDARKKVVSSGSMPLINVFVQGGYGRPGLNMLDTEFNPFYITGLRLNWPLDGLYTKQSDLKSIDAQKEILDSRMETFLYNTGLRTAALEETVTKLEKQIEKDEEIIALRSNMKKDAQIQLDNGTISVNDLISRINEENLAIQMKSLHQIQLLQTLSDLSFTVNE